MKLPRSIVVHGRRVAWRDLVELRRAEAEPAPQQPALFDPHEDRRPPEQRSAAARYANPTLFDERR